MSSDKRSMWIQATALVLFAGLAYLMVAVYARGFGKAAEAVEQIDASGQVITQGPAGTPTRAQVKQLHDALRKKLGSNARGLSRVASVDYDSWPDRLFVVFALDHSPLTMAPAQAAELRPMLDVLHAVHAGGLQWGRLMLAGTAPIDSPGGKVAESTVVRAQFSREKLDGVDWATLKAEDLVALADSFTAEPEIVNLRPDLKPPSTGPTSKPSTAPPAAPAESDQSSKKSK